jgi:hypothetical protein
MIDGRWSTNAPHARRGRRLGRALACSTFHHFADLNWNVDAGAPTFVTDPPGHEIERDPLRFEIFKGYMRNFADWLVAERGAGTQTGAAASPLATNWSLHELSRRARSEAAPGWSGVRRRVRSAR